MLGLFGRKKEKVEFTESQLKWNKLWDMWAKGEIESPYDEILTYMGEVQNGGHYQYFDNTANIADVEKHVSALYSILPQNLCDNLKKAYEAYKILEGSEDDNQDAEDVMERCDTLFYDNEEVVTDIIQKYADEYITL